MYNSNDVSGYVWWKKYSHNIERTSYSRTIIWTPFHSKTKIYFNDTVTTQHRRDYFSRKKTRNKKMIISTIIICLINGHEAYVYIRHRNMKRIDDYHVVFARPNQGLSVNFFSRSHIQLEDERNTCKSTEEEFDFDWLLSADDEKRAKCEIGRSARTAAAIAVVVVVVMEWGKYEDIIQLNICPYDGDDTVPERINIWPDDRSSNFLCPPQNRSPPSQMRPIISSTHELKKYL